MVQFPSAASEFVAMVHYARWVPEAGRRELWPEVVDRVIGFLKTDTPGGAAVPFKVWERLRTGMLTFTVMPSMRLVATAGPSARRDNTCIYNCAYLPVSSLQSFSELMFLLMCGTGVGFSVERENIGRLPVVGQPTSRMRDDYVIDDAREGWARAFLFGLETWFAGESVVFNYSRLRPYGAPLRTMGGRASGPEPLRQLFTDVERVVKAAAGRKLTSLECHDICCMVAANVIMGGKRRSAMISFSDLDDQELRQCKDFSRGAIPPHRFMANNSAVYRNKPSPAEFMAEFSALAASGSGERGICNVEAMVNSNPARELTGNERTNPCGEIILRPYQFCNLSEVVVRASDDLDDLVEKVKTATWAGVIQSTFTYFPFLRPQWRANANQERLIGVSLTGQLDNPKLLTPEVLKSLRKLVEKTARHACQTLGINAPVAHTCVKPSGTVSQLVDSASGLHPRWSRYYTRRYRISKADPVFQMLLDQGLKWHPEVGQTADNFTTAVVDFPNAAPAAAITRHEWGWREQLRWYLMLQENWCSHNASNTIYVPDSDWLDVANEVYKNWNRITGVSFLPYDGGRYELAPYEEITEAEYRAQAAKFPKLEFHRLAEYEARTGDTTEAAQEFACSGGGCEIGLDVK